MKLATVLKNGERRPALVEDGRLLDLGAAVPSLEALIASGARGLETVRRLAAGAGDADWIGREEVRFAPPVARPGKFICVGLNFRDHAAEGGHAIPDYPALFMRAATSLIADGEPIVRPRASSKLDYEAELVVVIGTECRHVAEADALDNVFGYTILNDASLRDYQKKSAQWTAGKNFDGTGPVGPAIVTADALPAGAAGLRITCDVNGERVQDGNTDDMIFPVARIIAILSEFTTLEPGDHIAMGTPAGVGFARTPPLWLKAGDSVEVEIEGIGRLVNTVRDEEEQRP